MGVLKMLSIIIALLFLLPSGVWAACTDSGTDLYPDTNELTDVNACVALANTGDTIHLPAGTATWGTMLTLTGVSLVGNGIGSTVITSTASLAILGYVVNGNTLRISGMTLNAQGASGGIKIGNSDVHALTPAKYFRIDHIYFAYASPSGSRAIATYDTANAIVAGVIDHNTFDNCDEICIQLNWNNGHTEWPYSDSVFAGNAMWATDLSPGSDDAVYVEANTYTRRADMSVPAFVDTYLGMKAVIRWNNITGGHIHVHGAKGASNRSGQWLEVYNNLMDGESLANLPIVRVRGGSGYFFRNLATNFIQNTYYVDTSRGWDTPTFDVHPLHMCDGTCRPTGEGSPPCYDADNETGYPCLDNCGYVGSATATTVFTGGVGGTPQTSLPLRAWMNGTTSMDGSTTISAVNTTHCTENTNWFNQADAPGGYTPYQCPHIAVTELAAFSCNSSIAGLGGYATVTLGTYLSGGFIR